MSGLARGLRDAGLRAWSAMPEQVRTAARPAVALARRSRARSTPLPAGTPPDLPAGAVELDTSHGTFWFDENDLRLTPWIRSHATWEADVVRFLERTLEAGMVVVDVGANVGFHTVVAARLVGETGHVYAVEPVPWTLAVLRANLWRHGCANVEVLPVAASDAAGRARLEIPDDARSGATIEPESDGDVVTQTLDALVPDGSVSMLKIDVEGLESRVLRGARELVARSPELRVIAEFRPDASADGASPAETLDLYESLGFEVCRLQRDGRAAPVPRSELLSAAHGDDVVNVVLRRR